MSDNEMLEWVEFVADKFSVNHEPWKYSRDTGELKHIRYEFDYTGCNSLRKRLGRFFRDVTIEYIRPSELTRQLGMKRINWFIQVKISWNVHVIKETNLPDGVVNGTPTNWEEDGEYITMFCPYVGREVLKFLRAQPSNPHAKLILQAMRETQEASWPEGGGE